MLYFSSELSLEMLPKIDSGILKPLLLLCHDICDFLKLLHLLDEVFPFLMHRIPLSGLKWLSNSPAFLVHVYAYSLDKKNITNNNRTFKCKSQCFTSSFVIVKCFSRWMQKIFIWSHKLEKLWKFYNLHLFTLYVICHSVILMFI